jgi:hypothetical protein
MQYTCMHDKVPLDQTQHACLLDFDCHLCVLNYVLLTTGISRK